MDMKKYLLSLVLGLASTAACTQEIASAPALTDLPESPSFRVVPQPGALAEPPALRPVAKPAKLPNLQPFRRKVFLAEVAAYTVPNILDGISTVRGVRRGFTEAQFPEGASELLGRRPGTGRYVLTMGAMETASVLASYRLLHSRSRVLRMLGHGLMAEGSIDHSIGFISNLSLGRRPAQR
jgi:hypothetical protein